MNLSQQLREAETLVNRLKNEIAEREEPIAPATVRDWIDALETEQRNLSSRLIALEKFAHHSNAALAKERNVTFPEEMMPY